MENMQLADHELSIDLLAIIIHCEKQNTRHLFDDETRLNTVWRGPNGYSG
jgi:hypothetical protein